MSDCKLDISEPLYIEKGLKGKGLDLERESIGVDMIIKGVVIERKSIRDFFSSLWSGRIFDQMKRLCQYDNRFLIVEGDISEVIPHVHKTREQLNSELLGFEVACELKWKIYFKRTKSMDDTIDFLHRLYQSVSNTGEVSVSMLRFKENKTPEEIKVAMMSCVPTVSSITGKRILTGVNYSFERLIEVLKASKGEKKQEKWLKSIFLEEYNG